MDLMLKKITKRQNIIMNDQLNQITLLVYLILDTYIIKVMALKKII